MSVAGSSYVPPVQLGASHALAPRDHGEKREQSKRRKPHHEQDEVELTGENPESQPEVSAAPVISPAATPGAYSAHGAAAPPPERHIDLNG